MATALPTVKVAPAESGKFVITCDRCPRFRTIRPTRPQADKIAVDHRAAHQTPDPADQVSALDDIGGI